MDNRGRLVSVICVVKNGEKTIERCIKSILHQDCQEIEFIVQDGASTDNTLKIIRNYYDVFEGRMKVVSEPDRCAEEGFFRALKRCTGDIIGSCLTDEELLPHACSWALKAYDEHPDCGAIYGDYHTTDNAGNIVSSQASDHEFELGRYLLHEIVPPFLSTFFRRSALEAIGLKTYPWVVGCGEFELWVRMAQSFPVKHLREFVAQYLTHTDRNSCRVNIYLNLIPHRQEVIERFFSNPKLPADVRGLKNFALSGLHIWIAQAFVGIGANKEAKEQLEEAIKYQPNVNLAYLERVTNHLASRWHSN